VAHQPPPIDWEAAYGLDWVGVSASLVYAPTFQRASLRIERKSIYRPQAIKKTELWAELPQTPPRNARESLIAIYRILQDAEADYWIRYLRERR
jgi:hypothetical protein